MDSRTVLIYSTENVPRLRYIAGVILGDILGLSWEVITDKRKLGKHSVINYSSENITGSFKISPDSLLFEKGIAGREIVVGEWKGLPVFFQTSSDSDLPFDIFAASFFLVSRYEEYLEFQPDEYGRFKASLSLAFKNGFLVIPIVDQWAKEMSKAFLKRFQNITFKRNEYKALLTIDTDQPFSYLGKSLLRSIGGLFRDIKNNSGNACDRYRIVAMGEKDPYEVFDYIIENIEKSNADAKFFFSVGDHSKYDKNPSWKNGEYRKLIHSIADKFKSGLHPSFYAACNSSLIYSEALRMKTILKNEIIFSRFHYIRLFIPQSYRDIHEAGILEDYSMGYPDEPGFRAGIARPYYFYDVSEDQQTNLKIIPFQVMDATLYKYKNLDPVASKEVILKLINETRKVGGLFVSIWHNTSLLDNSDWQEWREVFEFMLKNQAL
ncbi:MAG: polysaccharide deacetylase family protein [Bacteroidia bacterium]|nr:polysaccharide deacetylase family protein [Bacteroidia bacterium]